MNKEKLKLLMQQNLEQYSDPTVKNKRINDKLDKILSMLKEIHYKVKEIHYKVKHLKIKQ